MILEGSGFSAWITNSEGNPLPEYEVNQLNDNRIECWIPSAEDTNFEIRYKGSEVAQSALDLNCRPYLDGLRVTGEILKSTEITSGKIRCLRHHSVSSSTGRRFQFGRRELTDRDDGLRPDKFVREHLNTIRLEFVRGKLGGTIKHAKYNTPKVGQAIHEKAAKKGHAGSAKLGEVVPTSNPYVFDFTPDPSVEPSIFIFRYAPEEWLRAREIIPCTPEPKILEPSSQTGQKRPRDATPEAINVDDLETDDDDIVIVKHMIPAPDPSKPKRRKSRAEVKQEEEAEESDLEVEESEDVQPKQESDSDEAPTTSKNKRRKVKVEEDVKPKIKK